LGQFAVKILEHVRLPLCFDPLCNDLKAKTVGEHDNDADDFARFDIRVDAGNEKTDRFLVDRLENVAACLAMSSRC